MTIRRFLARLLRQSAGQDLVEFALLGGCIAALAYMGVVSLGQSLTGLNLQVSSGIVSQAQANVAIAGVAGQGTTMAGTGGSTTGGTTGGTTSGTGNGGNGRGSGS